MFLISVYLGEGMELFDFFKLKLLLLIFPTDEVDSLND